jgi:hypothetical protein
MPSNRYVILHHKLPDGEHWDLMLEQGDTLATWRLPSPPTGPPAAPLEATRIGNHRKHYLDYEGPVSGGRGEVAQFDRGHYQAIERDDDRWLIEFDGAVLSGRFALTRVAGEPADRWVFGQA